MKPTKTSSNRSVYKTIAAWIFAFIFVLSMTGVIYTYFPIGSLLNPEFYQQAMLDVNIYQRLPETLANRLAADLTTKAGDSDSGIPLLILTNQEWESILGDLIDPKWLQSQSEQVIDQIFYVLLESPDPVNTPVELSVLEIKESIAGPAGTQAINKIIEAQPPCNLDQLVSLVQVGLGMESAVESILCRPPDFILSEINPVVESILTVTVAQIPDTLLFYIPFSQLEDQPNVTERAVETEYIPEVLQKIRQVNTARAWFPMLPLVSLALMTLAAVRSLKEFMAWWGGVFFSAGLLSLILIGLSVPIIDLVLTSYLPLDLLNTIKIPGILVSLGITDLSEALVNQLQISIIIPSVVLAVVGFALLLGLYFVTRFSQTEDPQPSSHQFKRRSS